MRSLAIDNRFNGSVPILLQDTINWPLVGGWNRISVPDLPYPSVFTVTSDGLEHDNWSKSIPVKAGQIYHFSGYVRSPIALNGTWLASILSLKTIGNTNSYPQLLRYAANTAPTDWTYYERIYTIPNNVVNMQNGTSVRNDCTAGIAQVSGFKVVQIGGYDIV